VAVYDEAERKRLLLLHEKATESFDRAIMTVSGGALGISIAFVHDVASKPVHRWVLGVSWLFFALSLLLILWSFLTMERATVRMLGQMEDEVEEIPRGKLTDYANWGSAAAFICGVVFLVIFAWLNL
jgi:protein-S-isoprenylcysteine O-methyltransferase Ste14